MWHVSSRSGVATLRTAIHLLLTYLLHCALGIQPVGPRTSLSPDDWTLLPLAHGLPAET